MCIGYEAKCSQKRVPGVFSNPKKTKAHTMKSPLGKKTNCRSNVLSFGLGHCSGV